ncbi:unnamed protein product [Linum tenue]|uniref:Uncharacterized protein n=2 Tax=Linum tenue TaxID=586396 RepID=A0AAV0KRQ2_9ROSI|nr:unnamed protein product [Linum tenue]
MLNVLKEELGLEGNRERNMKLVQMVKLSKSTKGRGRGSRRPPVAAAVKQFLLVALGSLLVPTSSRICKFDYAEYLAGRVEDIRTFNWSGHVARQLKVELTVTKKREGEARARGADMQWVNGDIQFLMLHLMDFLKVRGIATNTIPSCSYWFEPRVDNLCSAVPKAELYDVAPVLLSREEVRSRFFPGRGRREWESGTSSSAPHTATPRFYTTEWWEETDLESLDTDELKALQSLTEKVKDKWDSWRESVRRVAIERQQDQN